MSTPPTPLIRSATVEDLPLVLSLIHELARFEKLPGPDEGALARLTADFSAARFHLLVGEADGALAGYAIYFFSYSTFLARPGLYLEDLYVRPEARQRGLGTRFLQQLAGVARERGCGRFEWTVLDWNLRAQALYRAMGARILPEWQVCRVEGDALEQLANGK